MLQIDQIDFSIKEAYERNGFLGVKDYLLDSLKAWKRVRISIAVTGESGAGKSAFINAFRTIKAKDAGAAKEDVIESTTEIKSYPHPSNKNILLWDVPGVGTDAFPKDTYLSKINVDQYDYFIIISCSRFTENDEWLAQEIEKRGKLFYFVRSKFGSDVKNHRKSRESRSEFTLEDEQNLKLKVIEDIRSNLKWCKSTPKIFVIDSHQWDSYDLEQLKLQMIQDIKDIEQQEAMVYTLTAVTSKTIEQKKEFLEKRIWRKALCAALAPRFLSADISILLKEQQFYEQQLNIDSKSLERSTSETQIKHKLEEFKKKSDKAISEALKSTWLDEMKKMLPFVPPLYNQVKFYGFSKEWLKESLDKLVQSALEVHKDIATTMVRDVFSN